MHIQVTDNDCIIFCDMILVLQNEHVIICWERSRIQRDFKLDGLDGF